MQSLVYVELLLLSDSSPNYLPLAIFAGTGAFTPLADSLDSYSGAPRPSTLRSAQSAIPTSSTLAESSAATHTSAPPCASSATPLSSPVAHQSPYQRERQRQPCGVKPIYIREGGSIPTIRFLEKEFNAPAAHLPCGQASDHAHLDNERLRVENLYKSREIFRWVFQKLGEGGVQGSQSDDGEEVEDMTESSSDQPSGSES